MSSTSFKRGIPVAPQFDARLVERFENLQRVQQQLLLAASVSTSGGVAAFFLMENPLPVILVCGLVTVTTLLVRQHHWRCLACDAGLGWRVGVRRCPHCNERLSSRKG